MRIFVIFLSLFPLLASASVERVNCRVYNNPRNGKKTDFHEVKPSFFVNAFQGAQWKGEVGPYFVSMEPVRMGGLAVWASRDGEREMLFQLEVNPNSKFHIHDTKAEDTLYFECSTN